MAWNEFERQVFGWINWFGQYGINVPYWCYCQIQANSHYEVYFLIFYYPNSCFKMRMFHNLKSTYFFIAVIGKTKTDKFLFLYLDLLGVIMICSLVYHFGMVLLLFYELLRHISLMLKRLIQSGKWNSLSVISKLILLHWNIRGYTVEKVFFRLARLGDVVSRNLISSGTAMEQLHDYLAANGNTLEQVYLSICVIKIATIYLYYYCAKIKRLSGPSWCSCISEHISRLCAFMIFFIHFGLVNNKIFGETRPVSYNLFAFTVWIFASYFFKIFIICFHG